MKILELLFRGIGVTASLSLFILGLAVMLYTFVEGFHVIGKILEFTEGEDSVIYSAMGIVDLILLSFSIFIASVGIYELFVSPIRDLPKWLQVDNLDALKSMLLKVVIVVMGISFMGRVVTWNGESNLLHYGLAIGAVTLALSYFLSVKNHKE
ncbi:MAG: YqhA family protein [Bacteroidota bacterium]